MLCVDPSEVDVQVHDGVVTLAGQLEEKGHTEIAASLTRAIDGVVDVVNRLTFAVDESRLPPVPPQPLPR